MKRLTRLLAIASLCHGLPVQAETLRFGIDLNYPPFSSLSSHGSAQGFDVDIAYALCREMKVDCLVVAQDWDGLIPALKAGKFDAILSSMQITRDRQQQVDFTNRYYRVPSRLLAKKGARFDARAMHWKIGVLTGSTQEHFARDSWRQQGAQIISYPKVPAAFNDLRQGKLDAVFVDSAVGDHAFLQTPAGKGFAFVGPAYADPAYFGEGTGIAVRKGDDARRKRLNRALAQLRSSGRYQEIQRKYFGFDIYGH